ncbi:MAG: bifunctional tetrahydrofolate synthase/dihydrofolate synthase [Candidatus Contendobacter sp.]|jgi:dihydrofolate synthase/folylpolyglutamate synthase|nr:bifunctional tetrahydrofolate synthase/dihydrofolate synthase [Gammaproteobacteria bacterium]MCC8994366.1 bifunctional tetrahydrofolate synthase/dihydrofolate synthase [Candidatus Contendobacter sp.]
MRFATLKDWLDWQETLHPKAIDLGLDRVRAVLQRLQPEPLPFLVITVGGTNGKGSCVAMLEAILSASGYQVGAYTSPHLLRYNERIRINGQEVEDEALCQTFARIDQVRGDQSLTYFEFSALAALELFHEARIEVAVLEVGLGGRLDAVNVLDADAALVVSIGLDHIDWLGPDRDSISYEKAGIYRPNRPAICADPDPPHQLVEFAENIGAKFQRVGRDYTFTRTRSSWRWESAQVYFDGLPPPTLPGAHQIGNAAAVLATLISLRARLPVSADAIHVGLAQVQLPGRFQIIPGPVEWILDVAHNPPAAEILAANLRARRCAGRTLAVVGILADKDVGGVIQALASVIDEWYAAALAGPRGRSDVELKDLLITNGCPAKAAGDVLNACRIAHQAAQPGDRIVILGSFHTVAPALAAQLWQPHFPLPLSSET